MAERCQEGFHQANKAYFKFLFTEYAKEFIKNGALDPCSKQMKGRHENNVSHHKKKQKLKHTKTWDQSKNMNKQNQTKEQEKQNPNIRDGLPAPQTGHYQQARDYPPNNYTQADMPNPYEPPKGPIGWGLVPQNNPRGWNNPSSINPPNPNPMYHTYHQQSCIHTITVIHTQDITMAGPHQVTYINNGEVAIIMMIFGHKCIVIMMAINRGLIEITMMVTNITIIVILITNNIIIVITVKIILKMMTNVTIIVTMKTNITIIATRTMTVMVHNLQGIHMASMDPVIGVTHQ